MHAARRLNELRYLHHSTSMGFYASYYTIALPLFVFTVIGLYLLFTGIPNGIDRFSASWLIAYVDRLG
jgi:hypothetical protein